jgi:excisionase family DNA binding protein
MASKRILWAVNNRDGTPLIVRGVLADVDQAGNITIGKRASDLVAEVLARDPSPTDVFVVPGIDLAHEAYQLIQAKHAAGISVYDPLPQDAPEWTDSDDLNSAKDDQVNTDTLEIIDRTLRLLFSQSHRYARHLGSNLSVVSMEELRQSPIGKDLLSLGRIAEGEERSDQETVFRKVHIVLELLFWVPGEDTYHVSPSFWDEPLGKMLSQAKLRSVDMDDLMSIGDAAQYLDVTRPTIYHWMDDGTLNSVRDEMSGRTFVIRRDVDTLHELLVHAGANSSGSISNVTDLPPHEYYRDNQ